MPVRAAAMVSSKRMSWNTPERALWALAPVFDHYGGIALDPASNAGSIVPARVKFAKRAIPGHRVNGLRARWHFFKPGVVFLNPPYGKDIGAWIDRCVFFAGLGAVIACLCPARIGAGWWRRAKRGGAIVVEWRGRIRFRGAKNSAPFPCAFLLWNVAPRLVVDRKSVV